tara:strand:+ start:14 stop:481 length:468 start_codon:yes stop_codon:yes gene_type:complete
MKAININGTINTYNNTPKSWGSVICGFDSLSDEQLKTHGFYDVVIPTYNSLSEVLSDITWDESNKVFTYTVNDKDFSESTINQLKEMQIKDVKARGYLKLLETDWYIIRKAEENVSIPDSIITERNNLRTAMNTKESEINALTAKKAIIEYNKEL